MSKRSRITSKSKLRISHFYSTKAKNGNVIIQRIRSFQRIRRKAFLMKKQKVNQDEGCNERNHVPEAAATIQLSSHRFHYKMSETSHTISHQESGIPSLTANQDTQGNEQSSPPVTQQAAPTLRHGQSSARATNVSRSLKQLRIQPRGFSSHC